MNLRDMLKSIWGGKTTRPGAKPRGHHGPPNPKPDAFGFDEPDKEPGPELTGEEFTIFMPYFVSTNVLTIWYVPSTEDLFVAFDNHREKGGPRVYRYPSVEKSEWDLFVISASKGEFVWGAYRHPGWPFDRLGEMPIPQARDTIAGVHGDQKTVNQLGNVFGNQPVVLP